jgi:hypothetical protein
MLNYIKREENPRDHDSLGFSLCITVDTDIFLPNGIIAYAEIVFKIPGMKISLTKRGPEAWSQRDLFDNMNVVMYNKYREAVS